MLLQWSARTPAPASSSAHPLYMGAQILGVLIISNIGKNGAQTQEYVLVLAVVFFSFPYVYWLRTDEAKKV